MENAVVKIKEGSGFFAADQYIVTCSHIFGEGRKFDLKIGDTVMYSANNGQFEAKTVDLDTEKDVVLLHAETVPENHEYLKLDQVAVQGSKVTVYGFPHNEEIQRPAIATVGSSYDRYQTTLHDAGDTTAGYSGGPVCLDDYSGNVVGVFVSVWNQDQKMRQIGLSSMIPASVLLEKWGNYLEEARYIVEPNEKNTFVYNSLKTDYVDPGNYLEKLRGFADDPRKVLWWAIVAEGGSGKSRLAYEFAHSLPSTWRCVLLRPHELKVDKLNEIYRSACRDLLIISDYAYTNTGELGEWLYSAAAKENRDMHKHRIRVLLLQRNSKDGKGSERVIWRETLLAGHRNLDEYQYTGEDLIVQTLGKQQIIDIMRSYAKQMNFSLDDKTCEKLYNALEKVDQTLTRPLFAMFITDALMSGESPYEWNKEKALNYFRKREISLMEEVVGSDNDMQTAAEKIWVLATITGVFKFTPETTLPDVAKELGVTVYPADIGRALAKANYVKQSNNAWIMQPMTPDILGEFFVLKHFQENPESIHDFLEEAQEISQENTKDFIVRMFSDHTTDLDMVALCCDEGNDISDSVSWGLVHRADYINLYAMYNKTKDAFWLIQYASGLVNYIAKQTDSQASADALNKLTEIYDKNRENPKVAVLYAKGLYNHFNDQTDPEAAARVLDRLEEVYNGNRDNSEVAVRYAKGLFNHYNNQTDPEAAARVLDRLEEVYNGNSDNSEVAVAYANGLFKYFCDQTDPEATARVLDRLEEVYNGNSDNSEVAVAYAIGLFKYFCDQTDPEAAARVLNKLKEVYNENKDSPAVAALYKQMFPGDQGQ